MLFQPELEDGIAIATASLWQMHCYNPTKGKHKTQQCVRRFLCRPSNQRGTLELTESTLKAEVQKSSLTSSVPNMAGVCS